MIAVVVSRADEASVLVGDRLRAVAPWDVREDTERAESAGGGTYHVRDGFELREFDDLHLHLEDVAEWFEDPELVVFVSRHAGETGPLLTAHFTGNVGQAEYGGRANELARACPNAHARVLGALDEHVPDGYEVGMECTHHGPSRVGAPSMFVEVGSTAAQWRDPAAATAVARAVLDLDGVGPHRERTVVGFGGGHYAPRFHRIVRETDWAVGHVLADWAIEAASEPGSDDGGLDPDLIDQSFERSGATHAVVDGDRPDLVAAIEDLGYLVVSETWLRETAGVPLDLVERAESLLCSVEEGLRFGQRRTGRGAALSVEALHPDLVGAALGVDVGATVRVIERHSVAYEAAEAGNRPTGRLCLPAGESPEAIIDSLSAVLEAGGASVERDGEELVVTETVFDPALARELGVTEGPAFGRLAAGEPIEVDGETVTPESVHEPRTSRYPIWHSRS